MDPPPSSNLTTAQLISVLKWRLSNQAREAETSGSSGVAEWRDSSPQDILKQERDMQDIVALIRNRHNALRPINSLPPEVLSLIFTLVRDLDDSCFDVFPPVAWQEQQGHTSWIRLTHVCHYWRQAGFIFPALWARLLLPPLVTPLGTQEDHGIHFLQRARCSPLHIHKSFDSFSYDFPHSRARPSLFWDELEKRSSQIASLYLHRCQYLREGIWKTLEFEAPSLQNLSLQLAFWNFSQRHPAHLPLVFSGNAPALKRLSLSEATTWANDFRDLTHLSLTHQNLEHRMSLDEFLSFLSKSPLLQHLRLIDAGPDMRLVEGTDGREEKRISLKHLHTLEIGEFNLMKDKLRYLLWHIHVPDDCLSSFWEILMFRSEEDLLIAPLAIPVATAVLRSTNGPDTLVVHRDIVFVETPTIVQILVPVLARICPTIAVLYLHIQPRDERAWSAILAGFPLLTSLHVASRRCDYAPLINVLKHAEYCTKLQEATLLPQQTRRYLIPAVACAEARELDEKGSVLLSRTPPCSPCHITIQDVCISPKNPFERQAPNGDCVNGRYAA